MRWLDLSGNGLGDVSALSALRRLDLSGNRFSDLWPLGGLASHEVLLDGNAVSGVGAPTHRLPRLRWLLAPRSAEAR
ncbi:MAG: hypothetical protein OXJ53_14005 [Gammaproteobacteria bacterium]|nr:hypothetical protein [Gammaproteobacteria bacterium]MDE0269738.1 hypothetical protein [Gammaproteobacteria bacterium]